MSDSPSPDFPSPAGRLLLPREVAEVFGVGVPTINRWVHEGRLPAVRTLGGHHRFRRADVEALSARRGPSPTAAQPAVTVIDQA